MQDVLDNAVWHSIDGPRRSLASRSGTAGRFQHDVCPFAGVAGGSPEAWRDLADLVDPGRAVTLFARTVELGSGWTVVADRTLPCVQMVAGPRTPAGRDDRLVDLKPDDVPEMLDLVRATQPGPFLQRTIEFGGYIGIRDNGRLVAMGGERLRCEGWTEISAICTADDQRGRGLGTAIVLALVEHIRSRGEEAFLHTRSTNTNAIRLYESLGFSLRCELDALVVRHTGNG